MHFSIFTSRKRKAKNASDVRVTENVAIPVNVKSKVKRLPSATSLCYNETNLEGSPVQGELSRSD